MLNASRAAQGIGAAVMFAVSLAVLSNAFPRPQERMKALAAYGATMGGAFAVGPLVGGALTSGLDWRWIFLINLPLGLLCLWIVRRFVAESLDPRAPRTDRPGLVTLTGGLFLLVFALLRGNEEGWGSTAIVASFAGAAVLLCAFVAIEARVARPMLPLGLFRNPSFTGAQVAAFGISASLFAMWLYMTLYLQQILGLSAIEAGLVYVPGTLLNFVVAGSMASVGQKVSARVLIASGLVLVGAGQALLTIVAVDSSWWLFLPGLLVAMVGTGILNPIVSQVALSSAPPEQSGLAAGVNDMFRQAGIAVGVAALGALVPAAAALGDGSPQAYVDGFHDALWVGAVLACAAAAATALLIRGREREATRRRRARVGLSACVMVAAVEVALQRHALGLTWVEQGGGARAANALVDDGRVWLIDPYDHAEAVAAAAGLGTPAGVLQLLDRHNRDCAAIAERLGVPLLRLPADGAGTPFTPVRVVSNRAWREVALWWPGERALVVPEAIGTVRAFALGRRAGVHPMLRLTPPRKQLSQFRPERLFVGHGAPIMSGADAALREALARSRSDLPRMVLQVPKLLRAGSGS